VHDFTNAQVYIAAIGPCTCQASKCGQPRCLKRAPLCCLRIVCFSNEEKVVVAYIEKVTSPWYQAGAIPGFCGAEIVEFGDRLSLFRVKENAANLPGPLQREHRMSNLDRWCSSATPRTDSIDALATMCGPQASTWTSTPHEG
jgi:hypothetical protein